MNGAVQLAIAAGLTEEFLEDLRDQLEQQPKPEPLDYGVLADLVAARVAPQIEALADRVASFDAKVTAMQGQMTLIARQQARLRRAKR